MSYITNLPNDIRALIWEQLNNIDLFMISMTCKDFERYKSQVTIKQRCRSPLFSNYPSNEDQMISYCKLVPNYVPEKDLAKSCSMESLLRLYYTDREDDVKVRFLKSFLEHRSDRKIREHILDSTILRPSMKEGILNIAILSYKIKINVFLFLHMRFLDYIDSRCFYDLDINQMKAALRFADKKKYCYSYEGLCEWISSTPFNKEIFDLIINDPPEKIDLIDIIVCPETLEYLYKRDLIK